MIATMEFLVGVNFSRGQSTIQLFARDTSDFIFTVSSNIFQVRWGGQEPK